MIHNKSKQLVSIRKPFTVHSFNKVIALLTLSDVFTWGFYSILTILSGVYLAQKLSLDIARTVGIGTCIFLFTRGISQLPIGRAIDAIKHDKDEIATLALGNFLMGVSFLFYPRIIHAHDYYLLQVLFGLGSSLNLVSWRKMFAKNLDNRSEGREYGMYETIMSLMSAGIALTTGSIANISPEYFNWVFTGIGILMMVSTIFPFGISLIKSRKRF